jgi:hypothetical protein
MIHPSITQKFGIFRRLFQGLSQYIHMHATALGGLDISTEAQGPDIIIVSWESTHSGPGYLFCIHKIKY